jgi:hypothetical protein
LGDSVHLLPHKRGKDFAETSFPARLYRNNVRIRHGAAMTSSVYTRFPLRFAYRFFSGLSFTVSPFEESVRFLTGSRRKSLPADFRL